MPGSGSDQPHVHNTLKLLNFSSINDPALAKLFLNCIKQPCSSSRDSKKGPFRYLDLKAAYNRQLKFQTSLQQTNKGYNALNLTLGSREVSLPHGLSHEKVSDYQERSKQTTNDSMQAKFKDQIPVQSKNLELNQRLDRKANIFKVEISQLAELFQIYIKAARFEQLCVFSLPQTILLSGAPQSGKLYILEKAAKLVGMQVTKVALSKYVASLGDDRFLSALELFEQVAKSCLPADTNHHSGLLKEEEGENDGGGVGYTIIALRQFELLNTEKCRVLKQWLNSVSKRIIVVGLHSITNSGSSSAALGSASAASRIIFRMFDQRLDIALSYGDRTKLSEFLLRQYLGPKIKANFSEISKFFAQNSLGYSVGNVVLLVKLVAQQLLSQDGNQTDIFSPTAVEILTKAIKKMKISDNNSKKDSGAKSFDLHLGLEQVDSTSAVKSLVVEQSANVTPSELAMFPVTNYTKGFEEFGGYTKTVKNLKLWIQLVLTQAQAQNQTQALFSNSATSTSTSDADKRSQSLADAVGVPFGVLVHGPPGCGKSHLARILASELHRKTIVLDLAKLFKEYLGDSELYVRNLFKTAASSSSVVLIDNLESVAAKRATSGDNDSENSVESRVLSTLLNELDGVGRSGSYGATGTQKNEERVVVIATTSKLSEIDDAIVRPGRFSKLVHLPLPSSDDRLAILKNFVKSVAVSPNFYPQNQNQNQNQECGGLQEIAEATQGWSGAKLSLLHREACYAAMRESKRSFSLDINHYKQALASHTVKTN